MRNMILTLACTSGLALGGCTGATQQDDVLIGTLTGATAGLLTAEVFDANDNWRVIAGLAGASVGALVARNQQTGECAYARGDGTYVVRPCPR